MNLLIVSLRIYEHSAWVAAETASLTTEVDDVEKLAELMADCVDNASTSKQLELIRAHPDLAGKAQVAGELTEESTSEQASAGLDQCSVEEYERFQALNKAYHEKFGFPVRHGRQRQQLAKKFLARSLTGWRMTRPQNSKRRLPRSTRLPACAARRWRSADDASERQSVPQVDSARTAAAGGSV